MKNLPLTSRSAQNRLALRTVFSSVGGSLMVPMVFLLALGADAFHLGVLNGLVSFAILCQVIGLVIVCKVPKARAVLFSDIGIGFVTLGMASVPFIFPGSMWGLYAAIALMFVREMTLTVARAGWMPLLQDNVPEDQTGSFFSRMRTGIFIAGFLTTIFTGWYIGDSQDPRVFTPVLIAAAAFQIVRGWLMRGIPEVWEPQDSALGAVWERSRLALKDPDFRATLIVTGILTGVIAFVVPPIFNSYLKALGYDLGKLVYLIAARNLGAGLSLWIWAKPLDRHGPRVLFVPSVAALVALIIAKAFVPPQTTDGSSFGVSMIYTIAFLDGVFFFSCLRLVLTKIHFRVIQKEWQTESFALISYSSALLGLILPPVAGLTVRLLEPAGITLPGIAHGAHGIVILCSAALMATGLLLRHRLPGYNEEHSSGDVFRARIRWFMSRLHGVGNSPDTNP